MPRSAVLWLNSLFVVATILLPSSRNYSSRLWLADLMFAPALTLLFLVSGSQLDVAYSVVFTRLSQGFDYTARDKGLYLIHPMGEAMRYIKGHSCQLADTSRAQFYLAACSEENDQVRVVRSTQGQLVEELVWEGKRFALSPNGQMLALEGLDNKLYWINLSHPQQKKLLTLDTEFFRWLNLESLHWSPNSQRLAFTASTRTGNKPAHSSVYLVDSNSTPQLVPHSKSARFVQWSSDSQLMLVMEPGLTSGSPRQIHIVQTNVLKRIKTTSSYWVGGQSLPALSPDGNWMAFKARSKNLALLDLTTGKTIELADSRKVARFVWQPDSQGLVLLDDTGRGYGLNLERLEIPGLQRTTIYEASQPLGIEDVSVSPDGRNLALLKWSPPRPLLLGIPVKTIAVYKIEMNGSNLTKLAQFASSCCQIQWLSDGSAIIFNVYSFHLVD